ncbi:MAG: DNA-processing protein DprA, partial [Pseudomonadota bacterium]|nr:DNA-processing protein DprA [Pseudomonadota bacterium]
MRLRLIRSENVGSVTFGHLLRRYGDASRALADLPELAAQGGLGRRIRIYGRAEAEAELEANHAIGARVIVRGMAEYPTLLEQCEDAPAVFSLRGHGHLLARPAVAMVGARNASANARRLAHALAETVAAKDYAVVSGMGRGIDTAAHQGALSGGTVAVLGGGIDVIYPRENADLYDRLVEGGALVAESPIGTQPQARNFPARNRIIAGLSLAVVVVEAAERSGSLITARLAGELGREVMAVPGSPLDLRCRGSNQLLRDGAHLIETGDDIVAVVAGLGG